MKLVFFRRVKKDQKGFSLVELMVVVAIIGILAALAVPRFQTFQAKARQSEAKTNLSHIYTLQQAYYGEYTAYAAQAKVGPSNNCVAKSDIGFQLSDCAKVRYDYDSTGAATSFTAVAENLKTDRRVNPSCKPTINDKWLINEKKALTNPVDASICD